MGTVVLRLLTASIGGHVIADWELVVHSQVVVLFSTLLMSSLRRLGEITS